MRDKDGLFEFGQCPMLELDDGTRLVQNNSIINYLGTLHNLIPSDPFLKYRGSSIKEYFENDFLKAGVLRVVWYGEGE